MASPRCHRTSRPKGKLLSRSFRYSDFASVECEDDSEVSDTSGEGRHPGQGQPGDAAQALPPPPGSKIEPGQTIAEDLAREVLEERGLAVKRAWSNCSYEQQAARVRRHALPQSQLPLRRARRTAPQRRVLSLRLGFSTDQGDCYIAFGNERPSASTLRVRRHSRTSLIYILG